MADFSNIIQEINTNLPDNNTQAITAAKLRTTLIDLTEQIDTVQDDFEAEVNQAIAEVDPVFATNQSINNVSIVNDLTTGGINDVLSAEQGKFIADTTMEFVEGTNLLNPNDIVVGKYLGRDDVVVDNPSSSTAELLYGYCPTYFPITDEGIMINYGIYSTQMYSAIVYNADKVKIGFRMPYTTTNGSICRVKNTTSGWINDNPEGVDDLTPAYVRFNIPNESVLESGDWFMVSVGYTTERPEFVAYHSNYVLKNNGTFLTGEEIKNTKIDSNHLSNETDDNALVKAADVKVIKQSLSGLDFQEEMVSVITSGDGQNAKLGFVKGNMNTPYFNNSNSSYVFLCPVEGWDKIRFLGGGKNTNASAVGYLIGSFTGSPNLDLTGFEPRTGGVYENTTTSSSETLPKEYEAAIQDGDTYAAITIWSNGGVTRSNFYCYRSKGTSLEDLINNINIQTESYHNTTTTLGNVCIHAAKEHNFSDGTAPIYEWFLVEEPVGKFYYSKNLTNKSFLFNFEGNPRQFIFGILNNGDILAVRTASSLSSSQPQSDNNRVNPYIFLASENWQIQHEIDFGNSLKPCAWQRNSGFRILPNGDAIFCEYTRTTVSTANVWKISGDASNPENWSVKKTITPIVGDGVAGYKHFHCLAYDFFTDNLYLTSGDADNYANIWVSSDYGENWTEIPKNTSLNNGQQYRMSMMTFTKNKILWATDTPGINYHVVYTAERGTNGILDNTTITLLANLSPTNNPQDGNYSSYGQALMPEYNAIFLFDRQDGGGTQADYLQLRIVDLDDGTIHQLGNVEKANNVTAIGFRTRFSEWYPINGVIRVGFGYDANSWNQLKVCGNVGTTSTGVNANGSTTVNNLVMYIGKNSDDYSIRFDTILI